MERCLLKILLLVGGILLIGAGVSSALENVNINFEHGESLLICPTNDISVNMTVEFEIGNTFSKDYWIVIASRSLDEELNFFDFSGATLGYISRDGINIAQYVNYFGSKEGGQVALIYINEGSGTFSGIHSFELKLLNVKTPSKPGEYEIAIALIKATLTGTEVFGNATVTISICQVEQLSISAETNVVVRGGDVRFTGSTTADVVYVYASEPGVFTIGSVPVAELPSDTVLDTPEELETAMVFPDSNGMLDFKVDVLVQTSQYGEVYPGTYYLYFYAPANVINGIDRTSDAQAVIAITVTGHQIVEVDIPSRIPYQGAAEVSILVEPGDDRDNVEVTFELEGNNIRAMPSDFGLPTYLRPDVNNYVNFTLDLKNYAVRTGRTIEPGLYTFNVKLKLVDALGGDVIDSEEVSVEIVPPTLDVTIEPSSPVVGDRITVTIDTHREGVYGYDHIWVTMVGTNYKSVQRVTLDSEGKGTVSFETIGLAPGTYKFYVRDTAGTVDQITEVDLVEEFYDLDPFDEAAEQYWAHDDILVVKTIQIQPASTNYLPVAYFTYSASGLTVTFDASSSYDPDGYIVSYEWNFGDGYAASGVTVTHSYSQPGTYTVTLTVTDNDGLTSTVSKQITIQEVSQKQQLKQDILQLILQYLLTQDTQQKQQLKQQILQMILQYLMMG